MNYELLMLIAIDFLLGIISELKEGQILLGKAQILYLKGQIYVLLVIGQ
jgi:hypothetical protein